MSLEIVFGDGIHGALKSSTRAGIGECPYIQKYDERISISREEIEKNNRRNIENWEKAEPMDIDSDDIICLNFDMQYGDISEDIPSEKRYESIREYTMPIDDGNDYFDDEDIAEGIKERNDHYLQILCERMKNNESFRIWYSNAPNEINGFYWLMSFFHRKGYYNDISAVYLPPNYFDGEDICAEWMFIESVKWSKTLKLEKKLTAKEIDHYSREWARLQKINSPLRLCLNWQLVCFQESVIDEFIYQVIERYEDPLMLGRLLGEVMCLVRLSDTLIFKRVKHLIDSGTLEVVDGWNESKFYRTMIKIKNK